MIRERLLSVLHFYANNSGGRKFVRSLAINVVHPVTAPTAAATAQAAHAQSGEDHRALAAGLETMLSLDVASFKPESQTELFYLRVICQESLGDDEPAPAAYLGAGHCSHVPAWLEWALFAERCFSRKRCCGQDNPSARRRLGQGTNAMTTRAAARLPFRRLTTRWTLWWRWVASSRLPSTAARRRGYTCPRCCGGCTFESEATTLAALAKSNGCGSNGGNDSDRQLHVVVVTVLAVAAHRTRCG